MPLKLNPDLGPDIGNAFGRGLPVLELDLLRVLYFLLFPALDAIA